MKQLAEQIMVSILAQDVDGLSKALNEYQDKITENTLLMIPGLIDNLIKSGIGMQKELEAIAKDRPEITNNMQLFRSCIQRTECEQPGVAVNTLLQEAAKLYDRVRNPIESKSNLTRLVENTNGEL